MSVPEERLDADLQALLDAERAAPNPSAEVQARVWSNVETSIAASGTAATASTGTGGGATAPAVTAGKAAVGKWVAAAAFVAVAAVGVINQAPEPEATTESPAPAVVEAEEPVAPARIAPVVPKATAETAPSEKTEREALAGHAPTQPTVAESTGNRTAERAVVAAAEPPRPAAEQAAPQPAKPRPVPAERRAPAPEAPAAEPEAPPVAESAADLKRELAQLRAARAALVAGSATGALSHAEKHATEFPRGQLAEERDALRIQALAALGRHDEALRRADIFRRTYPGSLMWTAVKRAVATAADR